MVVCLHSNDNMLPRLVDSLNPSVSGTSESLLVVANLFLVPAIAYILPGAQLTYAANQFRGSRIIQVPIPYVGTYR